MMSLFRKSLWVAALAVILGTAASARAGLTITVQEDSGTVFTIANVGGSPSQPGGVVGAGSALTPDYSVTLQSGQALQTGNLAQLLSAVLNISATNNNSNVLHIVVTGTGYTGPTAPPAPAISVLSHIGGSVPVNTSTNNTLTFQSFVNATGIGPQSPDVSTVGSFKSDTTGLLTTLGAPFSISEHIDITLHHAGDEINYGSSTTLVPTPAPAGLVLALTGLPVLGIGGWIRRRRKLA